jgi:hypothetical protein
VSAHLIALWSLLALLAACDKASLPTPPMAAAHAATAAPPPVPTAGSPSPELQQQCAQDARDWYEHQHAWEAPDSGGARITSTYRDHYSAKLGRCYIVVDRSTSNTEARSGEVISLKTSTLTDVRANRDIGNANWFGSNDAFSQCQVNGTACLSKQEWRELLKPYMEN